MERAPRPRRQHGRSAADALKELKASTPEAISGLLAALQDEDLDVRTSAARALGGTKASTSEVIIGLIIALEDQDWTARRSYELYADRCA
jgi:HEAT repeat protein